MSEIPLKMPRSASPVARAGAGDISERELSRERVKLQTTPPARLQPVHPKKQLFLTPVNKFTSSHRGPSPHLNRIRSCLDQYASTAPVKRINMAAKAASMEDLTPTKRSKKDGNKPRKAVRTPRVHTLVEEEAAARVARFMLVAAWRRRREDVRCVRRTLEFQVSCSEKLRIQVCALKSLLDSDNQKVRLAMKELERLKQLLQEKEKEKAVLEHEKTALEADICAAEDRASEMGIGCRNARNELQCLVASAAATERALALERAAAKEARAHRDHAYQRLSVLEEDMSIQEQLLSGAESEAAALRRQAEYTDRELEHTREELDRERESRESCTLECASLLSRVLQADAAANELRDTVEQLRAELRVTEQQLLVVRTQLAWWPAPLTRLVGLARSWMRGRVSPSAAILWAAVPPTHGCTQLAYYT